MYSDELSVKCVIDPHWMLLAGCQDNEDEEEHDGEGERFTDIRQ